MNILILGWYGTETIGDRAILAGLISLLSKTYSSVEITLGSLFPFFSERTISEDYPLYRSTINKDIQINLIDSKRIGELNNSLMKADLVIMGGGPLMDLGELFMIEYAFKKAKKLNKMTALLGCGVGPLFKKHFRESVSEITCHSDLIILRDEISKEILKNILDEFGIAFDSKNIFTSFDPAVECVLANQSRVELNHSDYISINLRNFPMEYSLRNDAMIINNQLIAFVDQLSAIYSNREIKLIPMHYFHLGGDDRNFLNSVALDLNRQNITVQNANLSLESTLKIFKNAYFNIGMRFHSVVLQTMISGKNFILDYTEPGRGKIIGFLNDIDHSCFYKNRYIALQTDNISIDIIQDVSAQFSYNISSVDSRLHIYIEKLSELIQ